MTSAAWQDRDDPLPGVRPAAASSGRRLAPVVYDLLKERLLDGEFQAGERLPVEAIRAEYGVSKQPVMEALRRLSSEGLVEIIPQVGCRVPVYSGADVTDFFAIFGGMEGAVAGVAAQRCTHAQIDQLAAVNGEIKRLIDEPDHAARSRSYLVLNRRFHGVIQDMAHSAVVTEISRRMWDMSDLLINTTGVPRPLASAVPARHDDHELIIQALRDRDQDAARRAMESHIVGTVTIINSEARTAR
ncbi:MAG: GntR family transcriptional regulator [Streptosporangiaceae bacterium]